MISDNPTYVFDKVKAKVESIEAHLLDAKGLCDFVLQQKTSLSDKTYSCLKQDVLNRLKQADDLLDDTIMIGNCNTSRET